MSAGVPSDFVAVARGLAAEHRGAAEEAEQRRSLSAPTVSALAKAGIFRMSVPKALGGLEVDPTTSLRVIEELARADASLGWCAMIAASTAQFTATYLDPGTAQRVFRPEGAEPIVAGTIVVNGMAVKTNGGYRVTGHWKFGSFCEHSQWLASNTFISDDGATLRMRPDGGGAVIRSMVLATKDCQILDTWHVTGMRGTGSHDYSASDAFVPEDMSFSLTDDPPAHPGPLYQFRPLFLAALGIVPLAAARSAMDLVVGRLKGTPRARGTALSQIAQADALAGAGRALLFDVVERTWEELVAGGRPSLRTRALFRAAITNAHTVATKAVDLVTSANGGSSIYASDPLERHFRDIHTMTTHGAANLRTYEQIGAMLLGAEPVGTLFG